jgi:hypothetical protein
MRGIITSPQSQVRPDKLELSMVTKTSSKAGLDEYMMIGGGIKADEGSKYLQLATISSRSMSTRVAYLHVDNAQKWRWEREGERKKQEEGALKALWSRVG